MKSPKNNMLFFFPARMENHRVWLPDPQEGFILGKVVDIGMGEVTVEPLDSKKKKVVCSLDRTYTAEDYDNKDVDDNCEY